MNYIRHLNAFFSSVRSDSRLTSSHVSLYLALFQYWNFNRFQNPFPVYRDNMMLLSKIGSKNTYHKCIKELQLFQYIRHFPAASKFQPVKISIIRLDIKQEQTDFKQLDLFGTNIGTDSVPILTVTSTDNDTVPVPILGQNIKHKHFNKTESKPPSPKILSKNEKYNNTENGGGGVPKSVHAINPTLETIESFFLQNKYPSAEAKKFFNHYKAIGWKIKGITPIEDWEAAADKWMINAKEWQPQKSESKSHAQNQVGEEAQPLAELFQKFLSGKKVFRFIQPEHFTELKLSLTDEVMNTAVAERINQVSGTNNHSLNQLWDAYLNSHKENPLIQKDQPNLIGLAKRIAVITHFHHLKKSNTATLNP